MLCSDSEFADALFRLLFWLMDNFIWKKGKHGSRLVHELIEFSIENLRSLMTTPMSRAWRNQSYLTVEQSDTPAFIAALLIEIGLCELWQGDLPIMEQAQLWLGQHIWIERGLRIQVEICLPFFLCTKAAMLGATFSGSPDVKLQAYSSRSFSDVKRQTKNQYENQDTNQVLSWTHVWPLPGICCSVAHIHHMENCHLFKSKANWSDPRILCLPRSLSVSRKDCRLAIKYVLCTVTREIKVMLSEHKPSMQDFPLHKQTMPCFSKFYNGLMSLDWEDTYPYTTS